MIIYREFDLLLDFSEVVTLLKRNLSIRHTKEFLLWKHFSSPSGNSKGVVAVSDNKIVGVVFYLPYNFGNSAGKKIKCLRPLDVCTSKENRGNGIFKNLMKFGIDCYNEKFDLLMATPNSQSYPELIKRNWKNFPLLYECRIGLVSKSKKSKEIALNNFDLNKTSSANLNRHDFYTSVYSTEIIKWRYGNRKYVIKEFRTEDTLNYIIYRLSRIKKLKCIILCDFVGNSAYLNKAIKEVCREEKIYLLYFLKNIINKNIKFILSFSHKKVVITYKKNTLDLVEKKIILSLGDLEGIL